jgi:hypothetical protein
MNIRPMVGIFLTAVLVFPFVACDEERAVRTESQTVPVGEARSARVSLRMGAGEVRLEGGAANLMEAEFRYNRDSLRPRVDYRVFGARGELEVRPGRRTAFFGNIRNEWDLRLGGGIPLELTLKLGAGQAVLDCGRLDLERLTVDMGVGEMNLDLRGPRSKSFDVSIEGGIGEATVRLPGDVGVRVRVDGGLGSVNARGLVKKDGTYVNDAYGKSAVTIDLRIKAGIGSVDLEADGPAAE